MMRFIFITNSPQLAEFATSNGVDRLMVDLELIGKVERQGHLSTVISRHSFEDVDAVRRAVPRAELMVRLNPVHEGTESEIDRAIDLGADILMLPMFRSESEVRQFCELVGGRVRVCLLLETVAGMHALPAIVVVPGVSEVHVGLNDLHLDLKNSFMFQPLADGVVDGLVETIRAAGLPFGIGGLARVGEGLLPAELLMAEHVRLGSTAAILSRTFHRNATTVAEIEADMDFGAEIAKLRQAYAAHHAAPREALLAKHETVRSRVAEIVAAKSRT